VLDQAILCGDHLLATQVHTHWGSNWPSRDARLLAGFAHGAAGIAYALVRLYEATGTRKYLDAALRGHRYERAIYSAAHKNWPLVRSAGHLPGNVAVVMTAWCHGAPGIGLARSLVRDTIVHEDPEVAEEIDIALTTTAALPGNPGDHVCCGNMGRCDVLFTAGRRLGRQSRSTRPRPWPRRSRIRRWPAVIFSLSRTARSTSCSNRDSFRALRHRVSVTASGSAIAPAVGAGVRVAGRRRQRKSRRKVEVRT
jgi:hypothetical protein